jgi:cyclic pyranopterin monophosphate synthase
MLRRSTARAPRPSRLSHLDAQDHPAMVDVGAKAVTHRVAEAEARVLLPTPVAQALRRAGHRTRKGPVFDTAILAGTMAAKRTSELIPFCHALALEKCRLDIEFKAGKSGPGVAIVRCRVEVHHKTGVEMEALTGAAVAALTIYDMCKALSHDIRIEQVRLTHKSGGTHLWNAA